MQTKLILDTLQSLLMSREETIELLCKCIILFLVKRLIATYSDNVEVETEQSRLEVGRKGYRTWTENVKHDPNELSLEQISVRLGKRGQHEDLMAGDGTGLHPVVPNRYEFLGDRTMVTSTKLEIGQEVKLKLWGSSHFVEVVWLTDSTSLTKGTVRNQRKNYFVWFFSRFFNRLTLEKM
jgi:hypothetical protein